MTLLLFTSWLKAWLFVSDDSSSSSSDSSGFSTGGIIAVVIFAVIFKITCLGLCIWRWTIRLRYRRSVSLRGWEWDDNTAYPYKFVRLYSASHFLETEEPSFQRHVHNIPTMHLFSGIFRNTKSKSFMLWLTECVWKFHNNVLWDTH